MKPNLVNEKLLNNMFITDNNNLQFNCLILSGFIIVIVIYLIYKHKNKNKFSSFYIN